MCKHDTDHGYWLERNGEGKRALRFYFVSVYYTNIKVLTHQNGVLTRVFTVVSNTNLRLELNNYYFILLYDWRESSL